MAAITDLLNLFNQADGDEMVDLLTNASVMDEARLNTAFGEKCYARLRHRAIRCRLLREERFQSAPERRENLVVIPGLLGTELHSVQANGSCERIWLDAQAVIQGKLQRLRLAKDGVVEADPQYQIKTGGVLKRFYGELMLSLAHAFRVKVFAYDWRKSLDLAATECYTYLRRNFSSNEIVHLVGVAEGGLVALLVQARYPQCVKGRTLLLGSPVYGSLAYVQALAGHNELVNWVDTMDVGHGPLDFLALARSLPSFYQLLPSPSINSAWEAFYTPATYGDQVQIQEDLLIQARTLRTELDRVPAHVDRILCVNGFHQPTVVEADLAALARSQQSGSDSSGIGSIYTLGDGDGRTPCQMADMSALGVETYYLDTLQHGDLLSAPQLLTGLADLLLAESPENRRVVANRLSLQTAPAQDSQSAWLDRHTLRRDGIRLEFGTVLADWQGEQRRSATRVGQVAPTEKGRMIEDMLARLYVLDGAEMGPPPASLGPGDVPKLKIDVKLGDIAKIIGSDYDAIVVGNYLGEEPQGAFAALEQSIRRQPDGDPGPIFTEMIQRNVIRSDLGSIFLAPDPRRKSKAFLVIAGQGVPGRFGLLELKVLTRELCWSLSRLGMRRIATVVLGDGRDGESIDEVIAVWMRGIKGAITGLEHTDGPAISLTFIQDKPLKVLQINSALKQAKLDLEGRMQIEYLPLAEAEQRTLLTTHTRLQAAKLAEKLEADLALIQAMSDKKDDQTPVSQDSNQPERDRTPIRLHAEFDDSAIRFDALTSTAAVAVRQTDTPWRTLIEANTALSASRSKEERARNGEILARQFLPPDLMGYLSGNAPLVVSMDSKLAHIHWELLRLPTDVERDPGAKIDLDLFLGLGRGLTRQLRTILAPRPDILPTRKRRLRVLVVADPASDAHLPGARAEGVAVADLFEMVNQLEGTENQVEVVRLIGPSEATHGNVLGELLTRSYDVLHFAGHCRYDPQNPVNSGWLFSDNVLMTPQEIQRTGRMPAFIMSNACESGITSDRSVVRDAGLAPTFAESFFAKGVTNFICTGWAVNDRAARDFAMILYAELLGLTFNEQDAAKGYTSRLTPASYDRRAGTPKPMYVAMRTAREKVEKNQYDDECSWGAYQHYGNPYARLFAAPKNSGEE